MCREFATRRDEVAVEYANLKECRTLFSAANEILLELTGEQKQAYEGLDGVFMAIWEALADYPEWTVLILDEVDHISQDTNYDPSDFRYQLLRGEGETRPRHPTVGVAALELDLRPKKRGEERLGR